MPQIDVSEQQILDALDRLSPKGRREAARRLSASASVLDRAMENLQPRVAELARQRGLDWAKLSDTVKFGVSKAEVDSIVKRLRTGARLTDSEGAISSGPHPASAPGSRETGAEARSERAASRSWFGSAFRSPQCMRYVTVAHSIVAGNIPTSATLPRSR